jgi:hypothetical protein
VTVNDLLDGHVGLDIACLDRIYLNGYVPSLQVSGQVVTFLTRHLGYPIPSPAIFEKIGTRFRDEVRRDAAARGVPVIRFAKGDRKIDVMRPLLTRAAATGRSQLVAVGVAQEFQRVFTGAKCAGEDLPRFAFGKAERRTTCFYFYVWDAEFGAAFIKICAYFPYPVKVWVNGHEWAKRQAVKAGIGFTELSNGFATCEDPARLQAICDSLGPAQIEAFARDWLSVLPTPFTDADEAAGFWWELSMRQVEVSRTIVFTAPRHARSFFEALIADNLDVGRPDHVEIIFGRKVARDKVTTFHTAIDRYNDGVVINANFKHSRIKQYLKDGRALRIETVINNPTDLGCLRRLEHLPELQTKARDANRRLLDTQRVGQGCLLANPAFERVAHPSVEQGRRAPALRFGDPRVMALAGALCTSLLAVTGITNRSLRALVAGLLGVDYTTTQMSYDLRRLRMKGVITRLPATNSYTLTPDGMRIAVFSTKLHDRLLVPLTAANQPPAPLRLRQALHTIDTYIDDYIGQSRIAARKLGSKIKSPTAEDR